jgi:hypothetical protein
MSEWQEYTAEAEEPPKEKSKSTAASLVKLAQAQTSEFFHDQEGTAYAYASIDGHHETHKIRSRRFKNWLRGQFYAATKGAPNSQALDDSLGVLEAQAIFTGEKRQVFVRLAAKDDKLYLDLADQAWRAVEISASGWRVIEDPPVRFLRSKGMLPLPQPAEGCSMEELQRFLNIQNKDDDWKLVIAWITFALRPEGPFPVLCLRGGQGAAKSTSARVLKRLIDPGVADLRAEPREGRDLMIAAENNLIVAFDNLSHLPQWLSDALCRLSTGGGISTRELYSDREEVLFDAKRPLILTGIEHVATSGDLLDRSVVLTLGEIEEKDRREENQFWEAFEAARPGLLAALLQIVADTLRCLPGGKPERLPRMADFARWGDAVGRALGWPKWPEEESFLSVYARNRGDAHAFALEESPVARALVRFMESKPGWGGTDLASELRWKGTASEPSWQGTASELKEDLEKFVGEMTTEKKTWPQSAKAVSAALRLTTPALRTVGIYVTFSRVAGGRTRLVTVDKRRDSASQPSPASQAQENRPFSRDASVTHRDDGENHASRKNPGNSGFWDGSDACDAKSRPLSGEGEAPPPPREPGDESEEDQAPHETTQGNPSGAPPAAEDPWVEVVI